MKVAILSCLFVVGLTGPAAAYVDPGILPLVYQAAYALVIGAVVAFVIRPWNWIRSLFSRNVPESRAPNARDRNPHGGDEPQ